MSTQANMLNQIIGSRCSKSGDSKRIEWNEGDSDKNVIALHTSGIAVDSKTITAGHSTNASLSGLSVIADNSDGSLPATLRATVINHTETTSSRRKCLSKSLKYSSASILPLLSCTSSMRSMQWRCQRKRQQQKRRNSCSLMLYPYLFFTSFSASNTSMQSMQKKMKIGSKQKQRNASKKQFYPKNSNQSITTPPPPTTTTITTELGAQQQQHKTSNIIYNRKSSMHNCNDNTNHRNGSYINSTRNKANSSNATYTKSTSSAIACSTIYGCGQKSIRCANGDHPDDVDILMLEHEQQMCTGPPRRLQSDSGNNGKNHRTSVINFAYFFKKLIHYLLIVNCLVYVVDGNLSMTKVGAFGAITSNYSIVPSATIAPISMPTTSINRSSDPTIAIASNTKNRKIGNSIRIDSDGAEVEGHSAPMAETNNMKQQQQQQQYQHHYNHHRTHKNSNNPSQSHHDESIESEASSEQYAISPSASSHHFQKMASQHQTPHSAHHVHSSGAHAAQTNKHSTSKHHQFASAAAIDPFDQTTIPSSDSSGSSEEYVGCRSCQIREQLKAQNLASIKMHILARLAMSQPPNITTRPPISEHLIQSFYSQNGFRYIRVKNNYHNDGNEEEDMNDMLGDDPATYHDESVSTIAEHGHDAKSMPSQADHHGQHHHHVAQQHHHSRHSNINNIKKYDDDIENVSHKFYNPDTEYNDEFDSFDERGGIVYNPDYYDEVPHEFDDDADEAFYSITDCIYSYPKLSKARHRGDILEFTIKANNHLAVSGAIFNLFVRGEDWIRENEPSLLKGRFAVALASASLDGSADGSASKSGNGNDDSNGHSASGGAFYKHNSNNKNVNNNQLSISINRFVHRNPMQQQQQQQQQQQHQQQQFKSQQHQPQQTSHQKYTRTDSNYTGEIPKGMGEWKQFNITLMVNDWIRQQRHQSFDSNLEIVQEVVVKTSEPWMRQLLVLDTGSQERPFIQIQTRNIQKRRSKRHLAKDCRENEKQTRCCRYPLRVDFRKFGWDWIIAPDVYEAYYCAGECPIGFLPKHPHTYIYSLSSSFSTCCSPRKLSSLSLLYFDENKQVIHSVIPNMAVEKCGCS